MTIPNNVILIWAGLHSAIPTGFTRATELDGRFPKGAPLETNPNSQGGNASHTHTSPSHSHTLQGHTHTFETTLLNAPEDMGTDNGNKQDDSHKHFGSTTGTFGGTTSSDAVTYGESSNLPPFYEVIFIKSNGTHVAPTNSIVLWAEEDLPDDDLWDFCDGNNSTPDLRNKYLRGAGTGQNAGTTGGDYSDTHDISHSHTAQSHYHSAQTDYAVNSGGGRTQGKNNYDGGNTNVHNDHRHTFNTDSATQGINAYSGSLTPPETVEPLHKKLMAIRKKTTTPSRPKKIIALFIGNTTDPTEPNYIPRGWFLCDGENGTPDMSGFHLKIANDNTEIGDTGGSNTHTHTAQSHSHTSNGSHSHTGSMGHVQEVSIDGVGSARGTRNGSHSIASMQSQSPAYDSATTTANESNNEPEYLTVAFIQYQKAPTGGAMVEDMM